MDEENFLKSFAKLLGPEASEALSKLEDKKQKEKRLLESFSASLSKVADFNIRMEEEEVAPVEVVMISQPVEPVAPVLIEDLIVEPVAEVVEQPEPEPIEEELTVPAEVPVNDLVTKAVLDISKNTTQKDVQNFVDKIPDSIRKEIDILKKSVLDLHSFAKRTSQMGGGGEVRLEKLDDVDYFSVRSAEDGMSLIYDAGTKKWTASNDSKVGYAGSQGVIGYTGSQGVVGYVGSQGLDGLYAALGYTGSEGPQGNTGYVGSQGIQGEHGDHGYDGSQGIQGYTGSAGGIGETGYTGSTGYQGATGYTGSFGDTGYQGSTGETGYQGSQGATGGNVVPVRQTYIADGTANSFTVAGGYHPDDLLVFLNGVKQQESVDVYSIDGTTVNFVRPPANNFVVDVFGYQSYNHYQLWPGSTDRLTANGYSVILATTGQLNLPGADNNVNRNARIQSVANVDIVSNNVILTFGTDGTLSIPGSIIPQTSLTMSLGNTTNRFESLWVGSNSITFTDQVAGKPDQTLTVANGVFYITDSRDTKQQSNAGFRVGNFLLQNNYISLINATSEFYIGTTLASGNVVFNRPIVVKSYDTGNTTFAVTREGKVSIRTPSIPANDVGALNIIGSADGSYQPVTNPGGMIHVTGNNGYSTRFNIDNFSTGNTSSFNAFIGRGARGTANTPAALQANDIMLRIASVGWKTESGFGGAAFTSQSLDLVALETFYDNSRGTAFKFYNAPLGGSARTLSLTVDSTGITTNNATINTITANGSTGVADQVLVSSGGTGNVHWAEVGSVYKPHYGSFFYAGANVALASTANAYIVPIASTATANGISIDGNNSIEFTQAGTYSFNFSIQYTNTDNQLNDIDVWLRKNTVDLSDTNSIFTIHKKEAGSSGALIAVSPFIVEVAANDKIQVMTSVGTGTGVSISTVASRSNPTVPRTPGVIYTINQIR
ncbi:hypothetical protein UFOVP245_175 [uncultured Caudovirales phage]|uniref:Collagen triple helix repeat n=1 Tax=uncultured Caudovirales phage TaxID=2100421 RepID=A0A6J7WUU1_9CAUD|nr:hypothetical protein UFOVP245_175 [uncultured Caudovirales phage]